MSCWGGWVVEHLCWNLQVGHVVYGGHHAVCIDVDVTYTYTFNLK